MKTLREDLRDVLLDIFELSDGHTDGTYLYWLTRVKEGFNVGTVSIDDFVEVDEEKVDESLELIMELLSNRRSLSLDVVKGKFDDLGSNPI